MKITIKTVKGEQFQIDCELNETVKINFNNDFLKFKIQLNVKLPIKKNTLKI